METMTNKAERLFRILDYFAAPLHGSDSLLLYRARSLIGTSFFIAVLMLESIVYIYFSYALGNAGARFIIYVLIPGFIVGVSVPFILRYKQWLRATQQLILFISYFSIVIGSCATGGPILGFGSQLLILQAALALFLLGIKGGIIWSGIVLSTQLFLYALHLSGFEFANPQPQETTTISIIFTWLLAFLTIVMLILLIEISRGQLEIQRHHERERFRYLATHDALTQLANRSLFEDELNIATQIANQQGHEVVLIYIDLDKFKPINDIHGHEVGDRILKIVASRLDTVIRQSDLAARLGGDEFAVLLPKVSKQMKIEQFAEIIHRRLTKPIHAYDQYFDIDCSIGICSYPKVAKSPEQLWQLADQAMYKAKKNQNKRWVCDVQSNETSV